MSPPLPHEGNPVTSRFLWTPEEMDEGIHLVTFHAVDDSLGEASLTFTIDVRVAVSSTPEEAEVQAFGFDSIRPNPATGPVEIEYSVPTTSRVSLAIYDVRGRLLRRLADQFVEPGRHVEAWDGRVGGRRAAAGVYLVRLQTPEKAFTKRVVVR